VLHHAAAASDGLASHIHLHLEERNIRDKVVIVKREVKHKHKRLNKVLF